MSDVEVDPGTMNEAGGVEPEAQSDDPHAHAWPFPADCDWLLAHLLELVGYGIEFGLTLNVKGAIVAGTAISGATYLRELGEKTKTATFSGSATRDTVDMIGNLFSGFAPIYERPAGAPEDYRAPPPNYVHMRDVTFISPQGGAFRTTGSHWRGRIQEVDAFAFGNYTPPV